MTGRTHDLAAFTALNLLMVQGPPFEISLSTAILAFSANMIGGLTPDIDQPTADLWRRLPAGTVIGKILSPILGGHRFISHSICGVILFGALSRFILDKASSVVLVDMDLVWYSFMIGFISHLIMDTFTKEGVPWLFPIPIRFGIPPLKVLRVSTGKIAERTFIFPGLLLANAYIYYKNYSFFITLFRHIF